LFASDSASQTSSTSNDPYRLFRVETIESSSQATSSTDNLYVLALAAEAESSLTDDNSTFTYESITKEMQENPVLFEAIVNDMEVMLNSDTSPSVLEEGSYTAGDENRSSGSKAVTTASFMAMLRAFWAGMVAPVDHAGERAAALEAARENITPNFKRTTNLDKDANADILEILGGAATRRAHHMSDVELSVPSQAELQEQHINNEKSIERLRRFFAAVIKRREVKQKTMHSLQTATGRVRSQARKQQTPQRVSIEDSRLLVTDAPEPTSGQPQQSRELLLIRENQQTLLNSIVSSNNEERQRAQRAASAAVPSTNLRSRRSASSGAAGDLDQAVQDSLKTHQAEERRRLQAQERCRSTADQEEEDDEDDEEDNTHQGANDPRAVLLRRQEYQARPKLSKSISPPPKSKVVATKHPPSELAPEREYRLNVREWSAASVAQKHPTYDEPAIKPRQVTKRSGRGPCAVETFSDMQQSSSSSGRGPGAAASGQQSSSSSGHGSGVVDVYPQSSSSSGRVPGATEFGRGRGGRDERGRGRGGRERGSRRLPNEKNN
jgi:hypothetical protein